MRCSKHVFFLLLTVVLLAGCRQGSFLEQRFTDFTAYYNTFYNAERSFAEGEAALQRQRRDRPVDLDEYLAIFPIPEGAGRIADFENTIRKSADVLRNHPGSRWVDDALLLIGKSYFYQRNYVGAQQKFRETIEVGSPLEDEARFWLARMIRTNSGKRACSDCRALRSPTSPSRPASVSVWVRPRPTATRSGC
jgi:cellulose synthase operon protein C